MKRHNRRDQPGKPIRNRLGNFKRNVKTLKRQIEENIACKENLSEIPETGMAVLKQQHILVQAIETWIASMEEKI